MHVPARLGGGLQQGAAIAANNAVGRAPPTCAGHHAAASAWQQPWRAQQQAELRRALLQPALDVERALNSRRSVVAAAAAAAPAAPPAPPAAARVVAPPRGGSDAAAGYAAQQASLEAVLRRLASSAGSRPAIHTQSGAADDAHGDDGAPAAPAAPRSVASIKQRLRERMASRSAAAMAVLPEQQQQQQQVPAGSNDTAITGVLQQLQQRMRRSYTAPGTRPALAKSGALGPSAGSSSSSSSSSGGRASTHIEQRTKAPRTSKVQVKAAADAVADTAKPLKWAGSSGGRSGKAPSKAHRKALDPAVGAVLAASGAPAPVLERLQRHWLLGHLPADPASLSQRLMTFAQAAALFGGPGAAESILARDASVMLMPARGLQAKLVELQRLLALQDAPRAGAASGPAAGAAGAVGADVLALVRSHPGILRLSCAALHKRLAALQRCLGLPSERHAMQVVRTQPRLLSMSAASLGGKVAALAGALGDAPRADAAALLVKQPLLLNLSAVRLAAKARALQALVGGSRAQLLDMLAAKPGVLLVAEEKLQDKWAALQALAAPHPRWRDELAALTPAVLARMLTAADGSILRLQYVAAAGAASSTSMVYAALHQAPSRFAAAYPGYSAWAAGAAGQARVSSSATATAAGDGGGGSDEQDDDQ